MRSGANSDALPGSQLWGVTNPNEANFTRGAAVGPTAMECLACLGLWCIGNWVRLQYTGFLTALAVAAVRLDIEYGSHPGHDCGMCWGRNSTPRRLSCLLSVEFCC